MERKCMKNTIRILIVDDELMMRRLLEKILIREGYQVLTAADGEQALEILRSDTVHLSSRT